MAEFFTLLPPGNALHSLLSHLPGPLPGEVVSTENSLDRVLTSTIYSPANLPSFPRSTMDGYAVRASDTFGATPNLPSYLAIVGEITMGSEASITLNNAQSALIHTGGMLPDNADAVVMIENTQPSKEDEIEILKAVAVGENVLNVGEDVIKDAEILLQGLRLRPQDIVALMALGITQISVTRRPSVAIISTGDEIVPPDSPLQSAQVRDVNSYTLSALITKAGGIPKRYGIISDKIDTLTETAKIALQECDSLIISAGSSASVRDITAEVLDNLGDPGIFLHGIAVKPGKPTILGACNGKPVFGLPGNPVSAINAANLLVRPTLHYLQGYEPPPPPLVNARLSRNIASVAGREDYIPVKLTHKDDTTIATPVFGKSNLIFTLVRSDGMVTVPLNSTGLNVGEDVTVELYT